MYSFKYLWISIIFLNVLAQHMLSRSSIYGARYWSDFKWSLFFFFFHAIVYRALLKYGSSYLRSACFTINLPVHFVNWYLSLLLLSGKSRLSFTVLYLIISYFHTIPRLLLNYCAPSFGTYQTMGSSKTIVPRISRTSLICYDQISTKTPLGTLIKL